MVRLTFSCGGCHEEATGSIRKQFRSITGKSYGIGSYFITDIEEAAPDGWIVFDPWTQCTYCPDCWADLQLKAA